MKISIITPTYNRKHTLDRLYNSLVSQSLSDFEWIVVDDGSIDNTKSLVDNFKDENIIDINYIYKSNGGKHTALNEGIQAASGDMIIIVDSDDYLESNAVETIANYFETYKDKKNICGFSFLKTKSTGENTGDRFLKDEEISNYIDCRINSNIKGDKAEVFFTDVLKQYPFPEFKGEKFISEDIVWIEIAKKYDTVHINKSIYICEYLEGGLTDSDKRMKFASPKGSMLRGKQMMYHQCNFKFRLKGAIIYNCYKMETDNFKIEIDSIFNKLLICLTYPLGYVFNKKWKKEI